MPTDKTGGGSALGELEKMVAALPGDSRRADWNYKEQPLNKWVGYHQHNSQIAWKVYANTIEVYALGSPRAGVMKSQGAFKILQRHPNKTIPDEVQNKVASFIERLPHLDFTEATGQVVALTRDPEVAKYLTYAFESGQDHTPQRFPVTKIEMPTADGELLATNREFRVIIREHNDVTYRNAVKGDLEIALDWVRKNKARVTNLSGREIIKELRALGFKGDYR